MTREDIIRASNIPGRNNPSILMIGKKLMAGIYRIPPDNGRTGCPERCPAPLPGIRKTGIRMPAVPVSATGEIMVPEPWPSLSGRCPSSRIFSAKARSDTIMASTPSVTSEVTNCFCCMFIGRFSFTMVNNRYETTVHLERVFPSFFAAICLFTIFTGVTGLSLINRNT